MQILENEMVVMVDVDDTLLMWQGEIHLPGPGKVEITDPYDESTVFLYPHTKHIEQIKKWTGRGFSVIVWSAGGYKWAQEAVKVLGIESYVKLIMTKPSKYVDDLNANEILGSRVYLPFKEKKDETNG